MPLYPEITPYSTYQLEVDETHRIYVEECGNPIGIPIVFIHGGPGSGCNESHRCFFNPQKYRIILFDQRGCGRSTPYGCLDNNTTHHLVRDLETIRETLGIDQWVLFAGSWGVALGMLYAQTYPQHVSSMILRGAFLASKRDIEWFFDDGVSRLFPELWEKFSTTLIAEEANEHLLKTYERCIFSNDKALNLKAAKAWTEWTDSIVTWMLPESGPFVVKDTEKLIKKIRLEVHYAVNNYFLETDQLIDNCHTIPNIPVSIIHGQRDITCPLESSWRIHKALPHSELQVIRNAGHLAGEPDMVEALVASTDKLEIPM